MILGMSLSTFTQLHVLLSLLGIVSGLIVVFAMLSSYRVPVTTAVFLSTTVATSATGFLFHFTSFGPPEIVGVISLAVLAVAGLALYFYRLARAWRWVYAAAAVFALYLNVFVGVVQGFQKIALLHALAPTQTEAPFKVAQGLVLIVFIALGVAAARNFRPARPSPIFA